MKKLFFIFLLLSISIILVGCSGTGNGTDVLNGKTKAIVFKSPSCGCCVKYVAELENRGFDVEVRMTEDMNSIKKQYNIPPSMDSCHTTVIGDYFVEGHVPLEAVNKLLAEQPQIDGIALPDMPAGAPGMPGVKSEPFKVYALTNGVASEFMTI